MPTRVKICGLTSLEDARAAVEAGADLLGFNFYPLSKRYIRVDACRHIIDGLKLDFGPDLGGVQTVGVFVNADPAEIVTILNECGLDVAQLSGDEPPELLAALGERAFRAVRPNRQTTAAELLSAYPRRAAAPALLVDAAVSGEYGGTGAPADWVQAGELATQTAVLLAGGLTPGNVAGAVKIVRPWGVDVASGVESAPGKKDREKMQRFVQAAGGMRRLILG